MHNLTDAQINARIAKNNSLRRHKLMTKELEKQLPAFYATEGQGDQAVVIAKYFTAWGNWTWYAIEYDPKTRTFFGLVKGLDVELGYFSLTELEFNTDAMNLPIERDLYFSPKTLGEIKTEVNW